MEVGVNVNSRQRALLVGAYERDNFGDILFLLLTEKYLGGVDVTAAAPTHSDMNNVFGRYVPAYGPLLKSKQWDSVWTVGGEIGRVSLAGALGYSLSPEMLKVYRAADPRGRSAIRTTVGGDIDQDMVYVPRIGEFPRNADAKLVINSVGLGTIAKVEKQKQHRHLSKLRAAEIITVRDQASSNFLSVHGIDHHMAPDLVHAISLMYPADDNETGAYLCVQASQRYLEDVGYDRFATSIAELAAELELDIKFFVAGTAPGHDSIDAYREIATLAAAQNTNQSFSVTEERHPLRLVEVIRRSKGWVGTSLHGRIVAESYGVPRISLSKNWEQGEEQGKTAVYSATWDSHMPFAVTFEGLQASVKHSLSHRVLSETNKQALDLSLLAHHSMVRTIRASLGEDF